MIYISERARGSIVVKALCYKPGGHGFEVFLAALGSGVYSASNRNEYQKQKKFLKSRALPVRRANNLVAICEPIV
jgi:hypothetical protein